MIKSNKNIGFLERPLLTENQVDILAYLALKGDTHYSDIKHQAYSIAKTSNSTVSIALKRLEQLRLIKTVKVKKSPETRGRPRKPYSITLPGLIMAMNGLPSLVNHIDDIARQHSDLLPLLFGKWTLFKEEGVSAEMGRCFMKAARDRLSTAENMTEPFNEGWKKDFEERIRSYPETVENIKKLYNGESQEIILDILNKGIEMSKKILKNADDKKHETQRVKKLKEYYDHTVSSLVDEITKETLFSFKHVEVVRSWTSTEDLDSFLKGGLKAKRPYLEIYKKDRELREFFTGYIEEEIKRNEIYLNVVKDLKESWNALNN